MNNQNNLTNVANLNSINDNTASQNADNNVDNNFDYKDNSSLGYIDKLISQMENNFKTMDEEYQKYWIDEKDENVFWDAWLNWNTNKPGVYGERNYLLDGIVPKKYGKMLYDAYKNNESMGNSRIYKTPWPYQKAFNTYKADREAFISNYNNYKNQLNELKQQREQLRINRLTNLERYGDEMQALKKVGINNPYFLLRNGNLGNGANVGIDLNTATNFKGILSNEKIKNLKSDKGDMFKSLMMLLMMMKLFK